jgi:hypothetical protein
VEPDIWVVFVVRYNKKTELEFEVQLEYLIDDFYNGFHLFHGPFAGFSYPEEIYILKNYLDDYLPLFFEDVDLSANAAYDGFYYCPMDKRSYL